MKARPVLDALDSMEVRRAISMALAAWPAGFDDTQRERVLRADQELLRAEDAAA